MTTYDWDVENCLAQWRPRTGTGESLSGTFSAQSRPASTDADITDERLEECYRLMAQIVTTYGDDYLPIFERLHQEIEKRKARQELLNQAREVSKHSSSLEKSKC